MRDISYLQICINSGRILVFTDWISSYTHIYNIMKFTLLVIAVAAFTSVSAMDDPDKEIIRDQGRGEMCYDRPKKAAYCGAHLECVDGYCDLKSELPKDVKGCIQMLNNMGANIKLGDAAYYGGYCYTDSCHAMYDKINSCDDPEGYCGGECKYCIKLDNRKCRGRGYKFSLKDLIEGIF
jgi:hypothetical protein